MKFLLGLFDKDSDYDMKSVVALPFAIMVLLIVGKVLWTNFDPSPAQSDLLTAFFWVAGTLLIGGSADYLIKKVNQK